MPRPLHLLLALLALAQPPRAGSNPPREYYIQSPFFNFFMAPNRVISKSDASHILKRKVSNCTCRNACFSVVGCQSWSVKKYSNYSECRISKVGPAFANLEEDSNSTYFFLEDNTCSMTNTATQNKTLTYSPAMLQDIALISVPLASPANENFMVRYGNDGNDTTTYSSMATNGIQYWGVELGSRKTIFHMTILPRQDSYASRFRDVSVLIGDYFPSGTDVNITHFSNLTLVYNYKGPYNATLQRLLLTCNGVSGRYLFLLDKKNKDQPLELSTFQAFAIKGN